MNDLLTFSLVLVHLDCHHGAGPPVLGVDVLVEAAEGADRHGHHHLVQVSPALGR